MARTPSAPGRSRTRAMRPSTLGKPAASKAARGCENWNNSSGAHANSTGFTQGDHRSPGGAQLSNICSCPTQNSGVKEPRDFTLCFHVVSNRQSDPMPNRAPRFSVHPCLVRGIASPLNVTPTHATVIPRKRTHTSKSFKAARVSSLGNSGNELASCAACNAPRSRWYSVS